MQHTKLLHPTPQIQTDGTTTQVYTIKILNDELTIMMMIQVFPCEEYGTFITSILMLNNITIDMVLEAFCTEQVQQQDAKDEAHAATT